jgi:hypothetical protein
MAKATIKALTEVPEALRAEYKFDDHAQVFVLNVEGDLPGTAKAADLAAANSKIVEFRDNNRRLMAALGAETIDGATQRAEALKGFDPKKFEGVDPEEFRALKAKAAKLKDKGVDDPDQIDARFKAMLDAAIKPVNDKLASTEADLSAARKKADEGIFRNSVQAPFLKAGGKADAVDFVMLRAAEKFTVVGGTIKARPDAFSADKPGEPLGLDEWLSGFQKTSAFAFEPSKGAGTTPGNGSGGAAIRQGARVLTNPTAQDLGKYAKEIAKGEVVIANS